MTVSSVLSSLSPFARHQRMSHAGLRGSSVITTTPLHAKGIDVRLAPIDSGERSDASARRTSTRADRQPPAMSKSSAYMPHGEVILEPPSRQNARGFGHSNVTLQPAAPANPKPIAATAVQPTQIGCDDIADQTVSQLLDDVLNQRYEVVSDFGILPASNGRGRIAQCTLAFPDASAPGGKRQYTFQRPFSAKADLSFRLVSPDRKIALAMDVPRHADASLMDKRDYKTQFGKTYNFRFRHPSLSAEYGETNRPLMSPAASASYKATQGYTTDEGSIGDKAVLMFKELTERVNTQPASPQPKLGVAYRQV